MLELYRDFSDIPINPCADLLLIDPPWEKTDLEFDKKFDFDKFLTRCMAWSKPTSWIFLFAPVEVAALFMQVFRHKFEYIWLKPAPIIQTHSTVHPLNKHEIVWAFIRKDLKKVTELYFNREVLQVKGKPYIKIMRKGQLNTEFNIANRRFKDADYVNVNKGTRDGTTILEYPNKPRMKNRERTNHPTQKPLDMIKLLIKAYCPVNGMVIDPTVGSGTTLIAAEETGRNCRSAEISDEYREIIKSRFRLTNSLTMYE